MCSLVAVLRLDRSHNLGCDKFSYLIQLSVYVIYQPCYKINSLQYYSRLLSENERKMKEKKQTTPHRSAASFKIKQQ